jgi:hypothetical protein
VNGILNFKSFLSNFFDIKKIICYFMGNKFFDTVFLLIIKVKNNLDNFKSKSDLSDETSSNKVEVNIEEVKDLASKLNKRRLSLGISQSQVINQMTSYAEPIFDESSLTRFEKLDITPRSAAKMRPALEKWLHDTDLKFNNRF